MIKMLQDRGFTALLNTRMENGRLSSTFVFYHNGNCKIYISVGHLPSSLWLIETININKYSLNISKNLKKYSYFLLLLSLLSIFLAIMNLELDISYQVSKCLVLRYDE